MLDAAPFEEIVTVRDLPGTMARTALAGGTRLLRFDSQAWRPKSVGFSCYNRNGAGQGLLESRLRLE